MVIYYEKPCNRRELYISSKQTILQYFLHFLFYIYYKNFHIFHIFHFHIIFLFFTTRYEKGKYFIIIISFSSFILCFCTKCISNLILCCFPFVSFIYCSFLIRVSYAAYLFLTQFSFFPPLLLFFIMNFYIQRFSA